MNISTQLTLLSLDLPTAGVVANPGRTAVLALLGAGVGLGLFLVFLGMIPRQPVPSAGAAFATWLRDRGWNRREVVARAGSAVLAAVVTAVLTGWVVGAVLVAAGCWFLPRVLGPDVGHAQRVARIEAVATWTEMIRDTLSAAAGLEQAILSTAPLAPTPIREEVAALATRLDRGVRLVPALRLLARDLADPTADLVVAALVIAAEQQARQLTDLLGALAATARERASMRMRVEAGRARSRTSVRVVVGTTTAFAVAVVLLNRPYLAAYDSVTGQAVLLMVGLLFAAGFGWLRSIAVVPEAGRLISDDGDEPGGPASRDPVGSGRATGRELEGRPGS
ncbi:MULTISPECIES: type II secretion system F family protein [Pseudonocardia]|uniref:Type II secretion system F family protein n=1 Tax=Pseudonocardia abyssalis TaxID=2792008 RepID=A0ABS6V1M7_9PSEU|nr:type II secretion system F family protein [Pseudonocardia abyssalis]MBW0113952.1 type II secretion system F family protein [Pseudonocardia abyssalis]MBW0138425.1 type II secretion system F family protein [Pseudonocardia abyssalis]